MKLYEAKNLIQSVFEQAFDKDRFDLFIRNLLIDFEDKPTTYTGNIIPNAFDNYIRKMERLGKFEDEDGNVLDILAVELKQEHSIEYARSAQRNFIRWYLAGSRGGQMKDAALVAFYTEGSAEWRFSLIKMQYSLETKKDEITPAKRSSFLVGEKGKSHTAQQQLVKLLKSDDIPRLSDLEEAFNVETVTNEFFEKYKMLALNLTDGLDKIIAQDATVSREFETKQIAPIDFAKKLLGQIVFLYFLQRKGWLGLKHGERYGEGDRNFLRSLFQMKQTGENFYNDYLEFLFYEALSKKRVTDEYSRFNCRIPFLNGGLFDPIQFYDWEDTDIMIPDTLFTNDNKTKEGDVGDGILDVFDRYNFTVNEAEPLEKEVAVDPEMLGKVFERMLEVKERKSKGAFYTPREIVHYMSQESLIHYLDSALNQAPQSYENVGKHQGQMFGNEVVQGQNELFIDHSEDVKVPKEDIELLIKHGEYFLENEEQVLRQGEETRTYKHKIPESIRTYAALIDEKLRDIRVCDPAVGSGAFPVGVMTEIVKARQILTPFINDAELSERSSYTFKSHCIHHNLYGVDIDASAVEICKLRLWLSLVVDEQRIDVIEPLPNLDYKIVQGNSLINLPINVVRDKLLEEEIEKLMERYYVETDKQTKRELKIEIDSKIKQLFISAEQFTNYLIDFDFTLFFHEVYNEKNGFDVVIGNPPYIKARGNKNVRERKIIESNYLTTYKMWDIFIPFVEKGIMLANNSSGITTMIIPDTIGVADYTIKLTEYIEHNHFLKGIVFFPDQYVFDTASVHNKILLISKKKRDERTKRIIYKDSIFSKMEDVQGYDKYLFETSKIDFNFNTTVELGDICFASYGLRLNSDKNDPKKFKKKDLLSSRETKIHVKKFIEGKYIESYKIKKIHWLEWGTERCPKRLVRPTFPEMYSAPKLLLARQKRVATYSSNGEICDNTIVVAVPHFSLQGIVNNNINKYYKNVSLKRGDGIEFSKKFNLKYVLAIINSSTIRYFLKYHTKGRLDVFPDDWKEIPIMEASDEQQKILANLVNYILFIKASSNDSNGFYFEQLIDGIVSELYFEDKIKKAGRDLLKHLMNLTPITDEMSDNEKMAVITRTYNELYNKNHPVRQNLYYMDTIEEVRIVKGLDS